MEEIVNKNILNPYIDALLRNCSFLYGLPYMDILKRRLSNINSVLITDKLKKNVVMDFLLYKKCIRMNENLISKDNNNNYLITFNKSSDFFKHSLYHELLHAASSRNNTTGIIANGGESYIKPLNEGITQMIADDISGYYENKFLGSYNIEKIIALILRESLSNEIILESYFLNPNILKDKVNNLAESPDYYTYLNKLLTRYTMSNDNTKGDRLDNLLKSVTLNIILPTYNNLNEKKREKYLSKLLYSLSGDEVVKNKIKDYISKYINYSKKELIDEHILINNQLMKIDKISDTMKNIEGNLNKLLILNDGSITILDDKRTKITSKRDIEIIYNKLFELNGYEKYLTNDVVKHYIDCVIKGKTLKLSQDSILKKRIMFCGIKKCLFDNGYYILNDFEELDKKDTIKLEYINRKVEYDDYKKICKCYSICKNVDKNHKYSYSIIYNSTKNEVEEESLRSIAFYANNWLLCNKNNSENSIDEVFSQNNKVAFDEVFNKLCYVYENYDNFDVKIIEKLCKNKTLINKLLATPIQVEWIHDYMNYMCKRGPLKERKGTSYNESINKNYIIERTNNEAQEIIRKIK